MNNTDGWVSLIGWCVGLFYMNIACSYVRIAGLAGRPQVGPLAGLWQPCIVPTMLTELLYPLQYGHTPLHYAAEEGHTTCVERLLSTPGIYVNISDFVS